MAKSNRQIVGLECSVCKSRNYITEKNVIKTRDKLSLKKYCKKCRKVETHGEFKKFH